MSAYVEQNKQPNKTICQKFRDIGDTIVFLVLLVLRIISQS